MSLPAAGCKLVLGAYYRSGASYFDDVALAGTDPPPSFNTGTAESWPSELLVSGTGGSSAINRSYNLNLASIPDFDMPFRAAKRPSLNGRPLYLRQRSAIHGLACDIDMPLLDMDATEYSQQWDQLRDIAFRKVRIWFLHSHWAARGFIDEAADLMKGYKDKDVQPFVFAFDYFYTPTVSGSTKTYKLLGYS